MHPKNIDIRIQKANICLSINKREEAVQTMDEICSIYPNNAELLAHKGNFIPNQII